MVAALDIGGVRMAAARVEGRPVTRLYVLLGVALLLASCGWEIGEPDPAPDIILTQKEARAIRMLGGWGPLPPSAYDVRHLTLDYDGDPANRSQLLRFNVKTSEADALASRLLGGGRAIERGGNCIPFLASEAAWWPEHCPPGVRVGDHETPGRGFARVIQIEQGDVTTMWLALGGGWH